ncbi:hypothetical protein ACFLZT_02000 [Thermodesulfobacteriota bacterium]
MEAHSWIIGQIIIDIIIGGSLLWFLKSHHKERKPGQELRDALLESETLLSEIRQISISLDKNLEEKRELSRRILGQLDEGLGKAAKSYQQLQKLLRDYGTSLPPQNGALDNTEKARASVNGLLAKGLSKEDISRHLGIPLGEMELLLKFQRQPSDHDLLSGSE